MSFNYELFFLILVVVIVAVVLGYLHYMNVKDMITGGLVDVKWCEGQIYKMNSMKKSLDDTDNMIKDLKRVNQNDKNYEVDSNLIKMNQYYYIQYEKLKNEYEEKCLNSG